MKVLSVILAIVLFTGCVPGPSTQQHFESAAWLGAIGAGVGAIIDKENRWRGAAIGTAIGSIAGYGLTEISQRAATEAARQNKTVTYHNTATNEWVEAQPIDQNDRYATVRTRTWRNGDVIDDQYVRVPIH